MFLAALNKYKRKRNSQFLLPVKITHTRVCYCWYVVSNTNEHGMEEKLHVKPFSETQIKSSPIN